MSEKITKVIVNRKMENENKSIILVTDTGTGKAKKHEVNNDQYSTRDYMTYLVALELKGLEDSIKAGNNTDNQYVIIVSETLKGINRDVNRVHYINNKTAKNGSPLTDMFVGNVNYIHCALERLGDKVKLTTINMALPHEYNGKKIGSKYNAEVIDRAWKAMDTILPKVEREIQDFQIE